MTHSKFPLLRTGRLVLRAFQIDDADALVELCRDRLVSWNTAAIPFPYERADAESFLLRRTGTPQGDDFVFAIAEAGALAGAISLIREDEEPGRVWRLGYWLGAAFRGRGLATEATRAILAYARNELDASAVTSGHFFDNPESGAVLRKAGLREMGERSVIHSRGRGVDVESIDYRIDFAGK